MQITEIQGDPGRYVKILGMHSGTQNIYMGLILNPYKNTVVSNVHYYSLVRFYSFQKLLNINQLFNE